ncbi:MAG: hypothetical protein CL917_03135 [Deltaproteobacteria bacterium]|nr:hypothetical protein [Deltaproteobacteria bacterium]
MNSPTDTWINPSPLAPGTLILASASPRRRELLSQLGLEFEIRPANIDESPQVGEVPFDLVRRLALEKATAIAQEDQIGDRRFVLGSDTLVVLDNEPIGKPADESEAVRMLQRLTGRTHTVMTGIAVVDAHTGSMLAEVVESSVEMRTAPLEELQAYVATGESLDKAGAYALQGGGRRFVNQVRGSESNVIGLPLEETRTLLHLARGLSEPKESDSESQI